MGMISNLLRVNTDELEQMQKDSSILETRVFSDTESNKEDLIDLDKTWEAIFYLITGHTLAEIEEAQPPLSWVLVSGQLVDEDQDLGYGPAHYLTPDQVKELNQALEPITMEELKKKYDGKKMNAAGVYPEIWNESDALDYIQEYFDQMKQFYHIAAREDKAVITFIS